MSTNTNRKSETTSRQSALNATSRIEATHDEICGRAYEIYCERCDRDEDGDHVSDWLQAEHELNGHTQPVPYASRSSDPTELHDRPEAESQSRSERLMHGRKN
jgi:hypothetical protein